jgi:hypothetical protein
MFWAFYDPQVKRDVDGPRSSVQDSHLPRLEKQAAPQTAKQLLFLLEDSESVKFDNRAGMLN